MHGETEVQEAPKAATAYLAFSSARKPFLLGSKCGSCGEVFLGSRESCGKCGARDQMKSIELGTTGRLYNYTIVYRSYPGVKVPFISAIVDLDGGGSIKGNLIDVVASPDAIRFDMPVEVVFRDAETANPSAAGFISHFFVPAKGQVAP